MDNLEEKLKPYLDPLVSRIEALEAQNKQLKDALAQNSKNGDKHPVKHH